MLGACLLATLRAKERLSGTAAKLQYRGESTEYHPFAVERHRIALGTQPRIIHDLRHRSVPRCLARPLNPGEHHRFTFLRLHGTTKVGQLAVPDIIVPALKHTVRTMLDEDRVTTLGVLDELLFVLASPLVRTRTTPQSSTRIIRRDTRTRRCSSFSPSPVSASAEKNNDRSPPLSSGMRVATFSPPHRCLSSLTG